MASSSRRSYPNDEDGDRTNASGTGRRPYKRARYSTGSKYRYNKAKLMQPCLGFEDENLKPSFRSSLHIDHRFLPYGIQPRNIIEIKGPEKSGKTFLLTYFIARTLVMYPEKKVLFINTRHKFNMRAFVTIVCHFDKEISPTLGDSFEERREKLGRPLPVLFEEYRNLPNYLDRVLVLQCHTAEDLMLTFGPLDESVVQKLLLQDENLCLVAVDAIDNYSYSKSIETSYWAKKWPNIMHLLKNSVSGTSCPVICTTLMPVDNYVYQQTKPKPKPTQTQSNAASGSKGPTPPEPQPNEEPLGSAPISTASSGSVKISQLSEQKEATEEKCISNFPIDYTVFTNIFELRPVSEAKKERLVHPGVKKITHCVETDLRSRHNANTAGSGGNHLVKFSIFSDMLWIV